MTRLWLIRHGPTHARGMCGWSDLPADLSDHAALNRLSFALPDAPVVSSDLSRAIRTADAIAGDRPRLPHDPGLREINFGDWELMTHAQISESAPVESRAFWENAGTIRAPGGESWNDLATRVGATVDRLLSLDHTDLILVAHFGTILTMVQRAGGLTPTEALAHHIDNLSLSDVTWLGDGWRLGRVNVRV